MAGAKGTGRVTYRVDDEPTDRALRSVDRRLQELEAAVAINGVLLKDAPLTDSTTQVIYHGLGRAGVSVFLAAPEDGAATSGRIEVMESDTADVTNPDKRNYILLRATGWGAAITVDVWVM